MVGRVETGWYKLPRSGQPYFGPVPPGAEVIDAPAPSSDLEVDKPAKGDKVGVWQAYAAGLGLDDSGTKTEIIARVEAAEEVVDPGEDDTAVAGEVAGVELGSDADEPGAVPGHEDEGT